MKSNVKNFNVLMIITIIGKVLAFVFEAIIAMKLGAGIETDSYFSVAELYTLIDSAFLGAITVVALNKYSIISTEKNEYEAYHYISDLIAVVFPIVTIISLLFVAFAFPLSYIVSPGSGSEARVFVVRCIRIMAVLPPIISITSIGLAVLRYKKKFIVTGIKSLLISVVGSVGILLFSGASYSGTYILSFSLITSNVLFFLIILIGLLKYGKITIHIPRWTNDTSDSLKMAVPLMMSYGITNVSLFVDKIIVSTVGEGSVSSLTYAQSLYNGVATIFITNLCTILLTDFNLLCAKKDYLAVEKKLKNTIRLVFLLLIPVTIETIVFHYDIVRLVYERGSFSAENSFSVGKTLLAYAFNFVPAMIYSVYNQILYACGKTKQSMLIGVASLICNIIASLALIKPIGISGIAVGTVISSVVSVFLVKNNVEKILVPDKVKISIKRIVVTGILIVACLAISMLLNHLAIPFLLAFVIATALCYLSVFGYLLFIKDEYAISIKRKIQTHLPGRIFPS